MLHFATTTELTRRTESLFQKARRFARLGNMLHTSFHKAHTHTIFVAVSNKAHTIFVAVSTHSALLMTAADLHLHLLLSSTSPRILRLHALDGLRHVITEDLGDSGRDDVPC